MATLFSISLIRYSEYERQTLKKKEDLLALIKSGDSKYTDMS